MLFLCYAVPHPNFINFIPFAGSRGQGNGAEQPQQPPGELGDREDLPGRGHDSRRRPQVLDHLRTKVHRHFEGTTKEQIFIWPSNSNAWRGFCFSLYFYYVIIILKQENLFLEMDAMFALLSLRGLVHSKPNSESVADG